jgi:hypothetical protein
LSSGALMSETVSALPLPENAAATPTSAVKPLFDADGSVMANRNWPDFAATAMSFHVTLALPAQPSFCAVLCLTPRTTGESMIGCCPRTLRFEPWSRFRYFELANQARSELSPLTIRSAPSSVPV